MRVGGVQRQRRARAHVRLAVPRQLGVRLLADQLGQLGGVADVDGLRQRRAPRCCPSSTSRGRGRPGPSRGGRTRRSRPPCTTCRRAARRRGRCGGSAAASTRPACVSSGCRPCSSASPCSAQPAPAAKPGRFWNTHACWPSTSTVRVFGSPSSSFSTQSDDFTRAAGVLLPVARLELVDERRDPLAVVLVGEVGAEGAAADVGCVGVDARGTPRRRCRSSST